MRLGDSYDLGATARLERLRPELARPFEAAFAAAEADLREWMPAAAREQEDAASFMELCSAAFDAGTTFAYAIVDPPGDVVIGYVNLGLQDDHVVAGYWVRPEWRGRGVAPWALRVLTDAAFAALPAVDRVHAHLDAANAASQRVLEKGGFHHHETFERPPRTRSESDTEWLYVRNRYPRGTETDRLILRDLEPSDLDAMVHLWTDPDVARFMDDYGPRTPDEVERWVPEALDAARSAPWFRSWVLTLKPAGTEIVGWISFGGDHRGVGDLNFASIVDRHHRGEGFATEALRGAVEYAFTTLGARSFWGECHPDNAASAGAMRAAGLVDIGTVDGRRRLRIAAGG